MNTRHEILTRYPNASEDFIKRNLRAADRLPNPQPQPGSVHAPPRAYESQKDRPSRCRVCVTSRRRYTIDVDNLAGGSKFLIDAFRYQGLIEDDSPEHIELSFRQEKVATPAEECTYVTIEKL